jgi:hypothetical protein
MPCERCAQAIQTLNLLDNIYTIGYVVTTWYSKALILVMNEVLVYAGRRKQDCSIAVSGIYATKFPRITHRYTSHVHSSSRKRFTMATVERMVLVVGTAVSFRH